MNIKIFGYVWCAVSGSVKLPKDVMWMLISRCLNWEGSNGGETNYKLGMRLWGA